MASKIYRPKIYSKGDLKKLKRRAELVTIIEDLERDGINIDMTKYARDTMPYLRQAILDGQKELISHPVPEPEPVYDNDASEAIGIDNDGTIQGEFTGVETKVVDPEPEPVPEPVPEVTKPKPKIVKKEEIKKIVKPKVKEHKIDWRDLPEYSDKEFVRKIYLRYLEREPDQSGLYTYTYHLSPIGGMSRHDVENTIVNSDEHRALQTKKMNH